jgi:4-hydroxybenzoate polyprenyltransferase
VTPLVDRPALYFAIAVLALIIALWLAFQIIGLVFKLIFFSLIVLIGIAAYQAWRASRSTRR